MLKKSATGFTLLELMITVVVLGALVTIALPSFTELIERGKVRSSAESVLNALQLARAEAVRRNEQVTFTVGSGLGGASWQVTDSAGTVIQQSRASGEGSSTVTVIVAPAGATNLIFNGFGRVSVAGGLSTMIFGSDMTNLTLQVEIQQPGGQIRLCDPGVSGADDPRRCLQ